MIDVMLTSTELQKRVANQFFLIELEKRWGFQQEFTAKSFGNNWHCIPRVAAYILSEMVETGVLSVRLAKDKTRRYRLKR